MIHVKIIANPIAGTKRNQIKAKFFIESLEEHFQTKATYTEYVGHAFILAKQAVAKHTDTLIAIGGDGTVNEVTQALVNSKTSPDREWQWFSTRFKYVWFVNSTDYKKN